MRCALLLRNCLTVRGSFPYNPFMKFQDVILSLQRFWADRGCVIRQPYDIEVGAGTFNPATFFRVLGPEPWRAAYVERRRRPADGRYGENANRRVITIDKASFAYNYGGGVKIFLTKKFALRLLKKDEHD